MQRWEFLERVSLGENWHQIGFKVSIVLIHCDFTQKRLMLIAPPEDGEMRLMNSLTMVAMMMMTMIIIMIMTNRNDRLDSHNMHPKCGLLFRHSDLFITFHDQGMTWPTPGWASFYTFTVICHLVSSSIQPFLPLQQLLDFLFFHLVILRNFWSQLMQGPELWLQKIVWIFYNNCFYFSFLSIWLVTQRSFVKCGWPRIAESK